MKNSFVFAIVSICLSLGVKAYAYQWSVLSIPDTLLKGSTVITRSKQIKLDVLSKEKFTYSIHEVYTILSESADWEEIDIYYNTFNKVNNLKLSLYDALGNKIKDYSKKDFDDYAIFDGTSIQSDDRRLHLETKRSDYPYTVELTYSKEYSSNFFIPNLYIQNYGEAVQEKSIELSYPTNASIAFKTYNIPPGVDSTSAQVEPGKVRFNWNFKNLCSFKNAPFSLPSSMVLPTIVLASNNFSLAKHQGSAESWESYSNFIYRLNASQSVVTPEIAQLVQELTKNAKTDVEKIDAIYRYVKEKMRFVAVTLGVGGWQSFEAAYVHKNFFGDCKALTNYTKTLLKEAGIESYAALIYRGDKRRAFIDSTFTDNNFNHVVLYVPGQDLWLECTSKSYPTGYLGSDNEDRYALLVKEKGGELIRTKKFDETFNIQDVNVVITLKENEQHEVEYSKKLYGEDHEELRYYVDHLNKEQLEKYFLKSLDQSPAYITALEITYDENLPIATIYAKFIINKVGNKAGNRLFLNANSIEKLQIFTESDKEERKTPFYLQYNASHKMKITYLLPEGYTLESKLVQNEKQVTDFGYYEVSTNFEDDQFVFTRNYVNKPGIFDAGRYKEFMQFRKDYNKLEGYKAVFVK